MPRSCPRIAPAPRARRDRHGPEARARDAAATRLELHEADGAFERIEAVAARAWLLRARRRGSRRRPLPRLRPLVDDPPPPLARAARAVPAPACCLLRPARQTMLSKWQRRGEHDRSRFGPWQRTWAPSRLRRGGRARPRRDRARRRLPGQPRAAPGGAVRRRPGRGRRPPRAAAAHTIESPIAATAGRSCPAHPSSSSRGAAAASGRARSRARGRRGRRGAGARAVGEGRRRARDDRRPRAQRPLARLRAGQRALARADGDARARRRRAHGLDRRGHAPRRRRPRRAARGDVPRRLDHGRPEDRGRRPDRRARAGRARRVDGRARSRLRQRRPRSGADDPDVRDRRGAHPPLGRRRHRLGLGSRGGDRRVLGQGRPAAARDRGAARWSLPHGGPTEHRTAAADAVRRSAR